MYVISDVNIVNMICRIKVAQRLNDAQICLTIISFVTIAYKVINVKIMFIISDGVYKVCIQSDVK